MRLKRIMLSGTDEERGLAAWAKEMSLDAAGASEEGDTYDFPIGMSVIRRQGQLQKIRASNDRESSLIKNTVILIGPIRQEDATVSTSFLWSFSQFLASFFPRRDLYVIGKS